jgi:hypothetical protein
MQETVVARVFAVLLIKNICHPSFLCEKKRHSTVAAHIPFYELQASRRDVADRKSVGRQ